MDSLQTLRVAWQALMRNKMRSFLTMLGIVIGVFAVIATVAVGQGAQTAVQSAFSSMGSNMLVVMSGASKQGGAFGGFGSLPTLTWDDVKAIHREVPTVRFVSAVLHSGAQVQSEDRNWNTSINGVSPEYFDIRDWAFSSGVRFTPSDEDTGMKVAVLGQTVVDHLFGPNAKAVGKTVRIKGVPFQIVGILVKKGQSMQGQDNDDTVFIPDSTFQSKIQAGLQKYVQGSVMVGATSETVTQPAQRQITALLRDRHHLESDADDDFSIRDLTEITGAVTSGTTAVAALLAAVAAISLIVGGIGIMNIMLVSVTERTREIGLRMAVGARGANILAQFLTEAVVLSVIGGSIGIALGVGMAEAVALRFDMAVPINLGVVLVAVGFSAVVGVGFGLYPARRASMMDPIEALRFE
ncbi:MAG TPA: ABC transporter permease [Vicinamibacterales bacterium]|jgi:putative ABC transport system permease protein|nr:ABC transporter permease [Vicinamibacterales bacterium]